MDKRPGGIARPFFFALIFARAGWRLKGTPKGLLNFGRSRGRMSVFCAEYLRSSTKAPPQNRSSRGRLTDGFYVWGADPCASDAAKHIDGLEP